MAFSASACSGRSRAIYAQWVEWLNRLACPLLAIDIPSGVDGDSGGVLGCAVRATHTATFIGLKPGLLTRDGPELCGRISVHDLDLPPQSTADGFTVAPALFAEHLHPRPLNCHKGMLGDAGVVGGAAGMVGAALLAGRAALKLGAGRVFVGLLVSDGPAVNLQQPELMLRPAREVVDIASALAVGPGLGQGEDARTLLEAAMARPVPLVLDADALNLIASHPALAQHVAQRGAPTVITPHPAEAGRLLGSTTAAVQADRVAAACELARRLNCHAVVKGCGSVVAAPDGPWFINRSGNPGMASAGMGDVLTGIALALLAQGWGALPALLAAVHVHGAAADALAARGEGPSGLAAGELIVPARRLLNAWIDSRGSLRRQPGGTPSPYRPGEHRQVGPALRHSCRHPAARRLRAGIKATDQPRRRPPVARRTPVLMRRLGAWGKGSAASARPGRRICARRRFPARFPGTARWS